MKTIPAFPVDEKPDYIQRQHDTIYHTGMSLRDYFAAKAMQGMVSAHNENGKWTGCGDIEMNEIVSENAYSIADAMLAEREKK